MLLDHDDLLAPHALTRNAEVIAAARRRRLPLLRRGQGRRRRAATTTLFRKPDWSPERLRGQMYTCPPVGDPHLGRPRGRRLPRGVRRLAGPRPRPAGRRGRPPGRAHPRGALPLAGHPRVRRRRRRRQAVRHHRRPQRRPGPCRPAGHRRRGHPRPGPGHLPRRSAGSTRPSSVSAGHPDDRQAEAWCGARRRVFVVEAVRSLLATTDHPTSRSSSCTTTPTPAAVLDELREVAGDRLTLVRFAEPFNYSRKMNLGRPARHAATTWSAQRRRRGDLRRAGWSSWWRRSLEPDVGHDRRASSTSAATPSSTPATPTPARTTSTRSSASRGRPTDRSAR